MTLQNPNIPEAIRAVAADGTQLRYALMELAATLPDIIALGAATPICPRPRTSSKPPKPPSATGAPIPHQ